MSTFSRSAAARELASGRTWKPTMMAWDALASNTSLSVMPPTPRCTTSTLTSVVESWANASARASAGPPWSALMMIFPLQALALLGDFAGLAGLGHDGETVTRLRDALEPEHLDRHGRTGLLNPAPALIEHGAHPAGQAAADEILSRLQRAALHQHRRARALAGIEHAFDHGPVSRSRGGGAFVEQIGPQQDLLEQLVDPRPGLGRDRGRHGVAAELVQHDSMLEQVLFHLLRVGRGEVDLVDRDDQRHAGVLGVRDGLHGLWHHLV